MMDLKVNAIIGNAKYEVEAIKGNLANKITVEFNKITESTQMSIGELVENIENGFVWKPIKFIGVYDKHDYMSNIFVIETLSGLSQSNEQLSEIFKSELKVNPIVSYDKREDGKKVGSMFVYVLENYLDFSSHKQLQTSVTKRFKGLVVARWESINKMFVGLPKNGDIIKYDTKVVRVKNINSEAITQVEIDNIINNKEVYKLAKETSIPPTEAIAITPAMAIKLDKEVRKLIKIQGMTVQMATRLINFYNKSELKSAFNSEVIKDAIQLVFKERKETWIGQDGKLIQSILADKLANQMGFKYYKTQNYCYRDDYYQIIETDEIIQKEIMSNLWATMRTMPNIKGVFDLMRVGEVVDSTKPTDYIRVNNGMVNKHTGELVEHDRREFSTYKIPCEYKGIENALARYETSAFKRYLESTFLGDKDAIKLAKQLIAISLEPNPSKIQKGIFLLGGGDNGKSLFLEIVQQLVGRNTSAVPVDKIDAKGSNHELEALIGKNCNIDDDATGKRLEETANMKKILTGGIMSINPKNKKAFEAKLDIVFYIALNSMPTSSDKSKGWARRQLILPFDCHFTDDKEAVAMCTNGRVRIKDKNLLDTIKNNELDIILAISLNELKGLRANNYTFHKCGVSEAITKAHIEANDSFKAFFNEQQLGEYVGNKIPAKELYEIYKNWCECNEQAVRTSGSFGKQFKDIMEGHWTKKTVGGQIYYFNVSLHQANKWTTPKHENEMIEVEYENTPFA